MADGGHGRNDGITQILNVSLPGTERGTTWDVFLQDSEIKRIQKASVAKEVVPGALQGHGGLLVPSLCHPHMHLDKAFLLAHPRYSHLQVEKGDFQEAMTLTGKAKSQFERADLLERGQRVIDESVAAGVTHIRAFVEVDAGVGMKCLEAGLELKQRAASDRTCFVQLCAFAQLPLFSSSNSDPVGDTIRSLMRQAASNSAVDVIGSTPYVEGDRSKMEQNVDWMIDLSIEYDKHLDFHLDYHMDPQVKPLVWYVLKTLEKCWKDRTTQKTVVLGHCTALTLFPEENWKELASQVKEFDLPVSFVGLPTSDLFMMRTGNQPEVRGTLDVPKLIKKYGLNSCIGVNNIGNAFTPQGTCDPLSLASQGVGIYQAGTKRDTELLFECVSTRARAAIGLARRADGEDMSLDIQSNDPTDLLLFQGTSGPNHWRSRRSVSETVYLYDSCQRRKTIFGGQLLQDTSPNP